VDAVVSSGIPLSYNPVLGAMRLTFQAVDIPGDVELFHGLSRQDVDTILGAANPHRYSAKSIITRQGENATHLYLLWDGLARFFYNTPEKKLSSLLISPGRIFGAAALAIPPYRYLAGTETVQKSTILAWKGSTIRRLADQFPQLLLNVYMETITYLTWLIGMYSALAVEPAEKRLAHILLEYASSIGKRTPDGIELDITNEELSNAAIISPYTASRLIQRWEKTGVIHKSRGKIVLSAKLFVA
jgi:CRP/FNR family transcriptional regulator, nitrogen oxide reductase regulator